MALPEAVTGTIFGNSYWWDGAGIELAQVDFYHNGVYCAGAECQVHSSNVAKGIYSYEQ